MAKANAAKQENYTEEMTATLRSMFEADKAAGVPQKVTVEKVAEKLGKKLRSVIAKSSREGLYSKAEYVTKTGEKAETKSETVGKIAAALGVPVETVGSLEAGTKQALKAVLAGLEADGEVEA